MKEKTENNRESREESLPEIHLRERRVHWDTAVVDNENLGRKKSNVCCVFHAKNPKLDPNSPCFDPDDDDNGGDPS